MLVIILLLAASLVIETSICIYLHIEHKYWKKEYNSDVHQIMTQHSGELRRIEDDFLNEHLEKMQLKERNEKLEIQLYAYRNLLSETHYALTQSLNKDYKTQNQNLRDLRLKLMLFAKQDATQDKVPISEQRKDDFIQKMMLTYPDITEASAQLAYMIVTDTPIPTICQILNISPKSVQMARFRMRKKMGLKTGDSLEHSLQALFDK